MNLQTVNGDILLTAQNRLTELQAIVSEKQADIQNIMNTYSEMLERSKRRPMTRAEFDELFPTAPVDADFVEENAQIAAKNAERDVLISELMADTSKRVRINPQIQRLEQEVFALEASKTVVIDGYHAAQANPHRSLTDEEFMSIYPAPTDADFAAEKSVISVAQVEANKIHSFFKSGPYPQPGLYDIDLLSGTAITYP